MAAQVPAARQPRRGRGAMLFAGALAATATLGGRAFLFGSDPEPGSEESIARTKELLLKADAVFFDVDSTVVKTEGIDLMGKCFGVMKEIAALTHKAMDGNVKFQDAMADRLELMAEHGMTRDSLEECVVKEGVPQWSPGVQEVVKMFHKQGTDVYLVSGGFKNMLYPLALELHIPHNKVYANEVLFNEDGSYAGFDRKNPTSASGGKPKVLNMMRRKHGYKTMIMFGDGATDMDARAQGRPRDRLRRVWRRDRTSEHQGRRRLVHLQLPGDPGRSAQGPLSVDWPLEF